MSDPTIRAEAPGDEAAIYNLIAQAFAPMPFADGDEQDLVDAFNAAIKQIRADGTYKAINDKYFTYDVYGAD